MNYRLASRSLRRAAGLILAAVAGRDLGGVYYPGGVVSYGSLLKIWKKHGYDGMELQHAAQALRENGMIRCVSEDLGLIIMAEVPEDPHGEGEPGDPESMSDRGGYYPEVVPLTTSRDGNYDHLSHESHLPVGLGGSSSFEWDNFDAWSVEDGNIHAKLGTHLGRLLMEEPTL